MPANPALADRVVLLVSANQARAEAASAALRERGYTRQLYASKIELGHRMALEQRPEALAYDGLATYDLAMSPRLRPVSAGHGYSLRPEPVPELHPDWLWLDRVRDQALMPPHLRAPSPFAVVGALTPGVLLELQPVLDAEGLVAVGASAAQNCLRLVRSHAPRCVLIEDIPDLSILHALVLSTGLYRPEIALALPPDMRPMRQLTAVDPASGLGGFEDLPVPEPLPGPRPALRAGAMAAIPAGPPDLDLRGRSAPESD